MKIAGKKGVRKRIHEEYGSSEAWPSHLYTLEGLQYRVKKAVESRHSIPEELVKDIFNCVGKSAESKNRTIPKKAAELLILAAKAPGSHLPKVVRYAALGLEHSDPYIIRCSASALREAALHPGDHLNEVLKIASTTTGRKRYRELDLDTGVRAECAGALVNVALTSDARAEKAFIALFDYADSLNDIEENRNGAGYKTIQEGFKKLGNKKIGEIVKKFSPEDKLRFESLKKNLAEWKKRQPEESLDI